MAGNPACRTLQAKSSVSAPTATHAFAPTLAGDVEAGKDVRCQVRRLFSKSLEKRIFVMAITFSRQRPR
jgi:hypothetical protein